jgi:hypothetical protein
MPPLPPFRLVVRLVIAAAALVAMVSVNRHFWRSVGEQGKAEAARDARPRTTSTSTSAATTTVPDTAAAGAPTTASVAASAADAAGESSLVQIAAVVASAQAPDASDSCQRPVSYQPINVRDNDPSTAWRVSGDGVGATLTLTLPANTHLTQVGLIPGYAKRDPCIDVDRFSQLRRITKVRWTFDGGKSVEQTFKDRPDLQSIDVDATTKTVTVLIEATTTEAPQLDFTSISDVRLLGSPAG